MNGQGTNLQLGVVGNCQIAALIDTRARIVWMCWPRLDADPVFCALLSGEDPPERGLFEIELQHFRSSEQRYLRNTAILETILRAEDGSAVKVTDFCPRFRHLKRMFRPTEIVRIVEPIAGRPVVRVRLKPQQEYGASAPRVVAGSHHLRFEVTSAPMRLTTNASINHTSNESWVVLSSPLHFVLGPDEPLSDAPNVIAPSFLDLTRAYWVDWVRELAVPFDWQSAVIRAAITLKLCSFEDTGAIVAALTTSIPEAPDSGRNWDYRLCWLRDSYFTVQALNRLGTTRTMEGFLKYIFNLLTREHGDQMQPVYGLIGENELTESEVPSLRGYRGMGPVRRGNLAWKQAQHDGYGSVILAGTQAFFDERLEELGTEATFRLLEPLGLRAIATHLQPDAGLWEYRGRLRWHTFSSLVCWAACDRLGRIAAKLCIEDRRAFWVAQAERIRTAIEEKAWRPDIGAYSAAWPGTIADASLLLLAEFGFLRPDDPRFAGTVAFVERELRRGPYLMRYVEADDFGEPSTAFNVCTFWLINALAGLGRRDEAVALFEEMLSRRTDLGLMSEDLDPETRELWGNFPQTYSMVGIVSCAMRLSRAWEEVL